MIKFTDEQWQDMRKGYEGKTLLDQTAERNLDAYTADVVQEKYLPRYSTREPEANYLERRNRAKNNFFNFPDKILSIYSNSIFRSTEPIRETENEELKTFWGNVDGSETHIWKFVKDRVFILNQLVGGCLIVVDKPEDPEEVANTAPLTKRDESELGLYPYAYELPWSKMIYFGLDKMRRLEWILLDHGKDEDGNSLYKFWDKTDWWVVDQDQKRIDGKTHDLGRVPVIRSIAKGNPKYSFQIPMSPLDEVVKISLKIFELMSMLDEMVLSHIFLKIAMPKTMYDEVKAAGLGNWNILVYPDGYEGVQAHYVSTPATELEKMIQLIFDRYPHMILEMANIRAKTDKPREESGIAKFIDSSDELSNLIEKAENMERVEREMTDLAAAWQGIEEHKTTISYSKNYDVKSVNEQIAEMVTLFKEDLHSPEFAKEMVKRVQRKMLGNVDERTWQNIENEVNASIDPSLSLDDIELLIRIGALDPVRIAQRYNPGMGDEEALRFVAENLKRMRAVEPAPAFGGNGNQ
jgi:hypothetical protein